MTREEVVERAHSAIGHETHYMLGKGGRLWHKETPWEPGVRGCDCSGFIAWCYDVDRYKPDPWYSKYNGFWLETSAVVRDARSPFGLFTEVPWQEVLPADVLVWGDHVDADGKKHEGHIGLVATVNEKGVQTVIHCSAGNARHFNDAIAETDAGLWLRRSDAIVACYREFYVEVA